ncbi:hypothetical protein XELAEV_18038964mg [Xenopus laevis]|uniref:Uncharacterized protein n=1 Tax=Xenopus laevis TaxID=8355 RepID=A0A974C6U9_XENLA|nr:hypothetical protein XELAEV_18038964mg [Xenopus laevis]
MSFACLVFTDLKEGNWCRSKVGNNGAKTCQEGMVGMRYADRGRILCAVCCDYFALINCKITRTMFL